MANLDELFSKSNEYDHPQLRSWVSFRNSAETTRYYVEFRRIREGLVYKPARLYFVAERKDGTTFSNSEPWDDDFNNALVAQGFKARDPENESERFGYMLEARMQPLVNQFNDGFFNAVLVQHLDRNGYSALKPISEKLAKIHVNKPADGEPASDCSARIDSVLARCAEELVHLSYTPKDGKSVLAAAIAYYLDDRFSITNSAMLGW